MSFISFAFLCLYVLALSVRWFPGTSGVALSGGRLLALLLLSWIFYAWHAPWYILLILFSTVVDYLAGLLLDRAPAGRRGLRKLILIGSLASNLGLLAYFKYADFIVTGINDIGGVTWTLPQVLLPVGISFYTFQSLSYSIDVYRGAIRAERSFARFACYIAFFPQLVAGPIVRASQFLYQLGRRRRLHLPVFTLGAYLILRGLFLKLVLADNLGRIIELHWEQAAMDPDGALALSMLVFFACQLLCDFSGYVDIARGVAYHLGIRLPLNFNAPYIATTFAGFWSRWHITLSHWLRDYLYLPLGGNRKGRERTCLNLLLVMLLSGLWHGAAWTYISWGAVLGLALVIERCLGIRSRRRAPLSVLAWFLMVQLTWIFSMGLFRATDLAQGIAITGRALQGFVDLLFGGYAVPSGAELLTLGWWLTLPVVLMHARAWLTENTFLGAPRVLERTAYAGAMLAALLTLHATGSQFIYFQF